MTQRNLFPSLCLVAASVFIAPAASAAEAVAQSWNKPILVGSNDSGDAYYPLVNFDDKGNAISVWEETDGKRFSIWSSRYVPGTGWSKPELIEQNDDGDAMNHYLALHSSGSAIVVWMQGSEKTFLKNAPRIDTWANRYTPGRGWETARLIDLPTAGLTRFPHVAIDRKGNAMAAWHRSDGGNFSIYTSRCTAGGDWTKPELIEFDDAGNAFWPRVALDGEGNAIVTWNQSDGNLYSIWANRYTPANGWEKPQLIENDNAGNAYYSRTVFDSKGNAISVWEQYDEKTSRIWSNRYVAGKGWGKAERIDRPDSINAVYPQIDIDANDNAIVVWNQNEGMHASAWANRYVAGRGWGKAEQISSADTADLIGTRIALQPNGNAFAVWQQNENERYSIWANRYIAGRGWGKAELLEHNDTGHAIGPSIAVDSNGRAIAMWQQQTDSKLFKIWASRFE